MAPTDRSDLDARLARLAQHYPHDPLTPPEEDADSAPWLFGTGLVRLLEDSLLDEEPLDGVADLLQVLLSDGDAEHAKELLTVLTCDELTAMLPMTTRELYSDEAPAMRKFINAELKAKG